MKKIKVLTDDCIGCGACVGIDPEHFTFNDEGYSIPKSNENLDSEALMNAIESCPVGIISFEEVRDENTEKNISIEQTNDEEVGENVSIEQTDDEEYTENE